MRLKSSILENIRSRSLVGLLTLSIIGLSFLTVLVFGLFSAIRQSKRFSEESENLRNSFTEAQKKLVKNEVDKAIEYIEYNRSLSLEQIKLGLKTRVDESWAIANNIYQENKATKSQAEIKKMIKDALRPIRFNSGRGDIFIYTTDGISVLLPRSREFEDRLSLDLQDSLGNFLVKNEVALLSEVDQGFLTYRAPSNNQLGDSAIYKYTYIRKFAPFEWYFGSKDFLNNYEDDLKHELLNWIVNIRYSNEGYIFINAMDGKALLTNGIKPEQPTDIFKSGDKNWINIFKQQLRIAKTTGSGYMEYQFIKLASKDFEPKVSYISIVKDWGWIVGAGFYKNDIESEIAGKQRALNEKINGWIIRLFVFTVLFLILAYTLAKIVSGRLKMEFSRFTGNFRKASLESELMDTSLISFAEFRSLAESVNNTISERDYARQALEKEQALLRSLIDSIPDFIFFKDINSNYIGCNIAFANYLGRSEKDIIGRNDFDFFPKESAEFYHNFDRKILQDHIPIRSEEWNVFPDGSRRLLDTVKVLFYDKNGSVLGILAISRDITEKEEIQLQFREAKEKAEESDRLKTAFLANMSHEIRTPMNSIIGFSTLLTEDHLTEADKAEYIQHINHAGESLLNLIDDIIDIAKIEAGQLTVSYENYSLNELMDELHVTYSDVIRRKFNTEVTLIAEHVKLPKGNTILTDPFRLRQVISNLLGNAVKFTSKGKITYGFRPEGDDLLFYIQDTGIGISIENQEIIFKRFRQALHNGKRHQGGTGLGLAISQHIVGLLGGKIWVESSQGQGSTFFFTIPYKPVDSSQTDAGSKSPERALFFDWSSKTLLVVEDVDSNFNYISAALARTGIKLLRSTDGLSGVDVCLSDKTIDLVIMDFNLPGFDGYEATRQIKQHRPSLPVIAQTTYAFQDEIDRSLEAGCDDYISKPVKFNILMNVLAKYLDMNK
ncbi:MAG: cache domain-containing protein [Bacteroidota bacterium]